MFDTTTAARPPISASQPPPPLDPAAALTAANTGPVGPFAISALATLDSDQLDYGARVDLLVAWHRQAAWVAAQEQAVILAVAGPTPDDEDDFVRETVAAALRLSPASAARRIALARSLAQLR